MDLTQIDLSKLILTAVASRPDDPLRTYIGASSIGHPCARRIWYDFHSSPKTPFTPNTRVTFDVGKILEGNVLDYIALAVEKEPSMQLIRPSEENHFLYCFESEVPLFQGHMDGILIVDGKPCVLEIKTAKSSRFTAFKNKGLQVFSIGYYAQLQAYMGMRGYKHAVLIALNKDSSEFHHEWVVFDPYYYSELCTKAAMIVDAVEPPVRINRNPTYFVCTTCNYKRTCFFAGDANA